MYNINICHKQICRYNRFVDLLYKPVRLGDAKKDEKIDRQHILIAIENLIEK